MSHTVYKTPKSVTSFQCLIPVLVLQVLEWNVLQLSPPQNKFSQPTHRSAKVNPFSVEIREGFIF